MLPGLLQSRMKELPSTWEFRIGVAVALVVFHLAAFSRAGHVRLGVPFNSAPGSTPYYSNPDAPELMPFPRQPHYWTRLITSRWDSEHYIGFAVRGLTACPAKGARDQQLMQCGLAWMPAYGEIAGRISTITGVAPDYVLLAMSILATLIMNLLWTSKTIVGQLGRFESYAAMLAVNLFATGFYLVTPYMEAATWACLLGGYILLSKNRWFEAALCIGATTALRPTAVGIALGFGCAALFKAWHARKSGEKRWWLPIAATPLAVWGLVAMMIAFQITVGHWDAFLRAQRAFAYPHGGLHWHQLIDPVFYLHSFNAQHMDGVILFGSASIIALAARPLVRQLGRPQAIFLVVTSAVMVLLPLAALNGYWGLNRYLLLCPLTFFCAGVLARRYPLVFGAWMIVSIFFYWHIEMCSYVAHGNPQICPCLGPVEFQAPWQG
jgi:hypothetical protein